MKRGVVLPLLGVLAALSPRAAAQDSSATATALRLFDEAEQAMADGRIEQGCSKYADSERVQAQLGTLLHLADCEEKLGKVASAWSNFRQAGEIARQRNDPRADLAHDRARALEPRVSKLTVELAPANRTPGLELVVNGAPLAAALWGSATPTDPGPVTIEASAPGYQTWNTSAVLSEGAEQTIAIPALVAASPTPVNPAVPAPPPTSEKSGNAAGTLRTVGWITAGVGVVGLGLSGVFLAERNSALDDRDGVCKGYVGCSPDQIGRIQSLTDKAQSNDTLGRVSFIAGGVLAVGGVALVLLAPKLAPRVEQKAARSAWLLPTLGQGSAGLIGGGHF